MNKGKKETGHNMLDFNEFKTFYKVGKICGKKKKKRRKEERREEKKKEEKEKVRKKEKE